MASRPLPGQRVGYFRWYQCFRVGVAVAFPIVGVAASQSSDEPEQAPPFSSRTRSDSRGTGKILLPRGVKFATAAVIVSGHQKSATVSHEMSGLNWKPFVYGGLASIVAEFGTFPVDLTKTRLQVQGQSIDVRFKEIKYRGMFHALFRIYKEEGILALYSGIAPALLRQASYGTIKIGIYQSLKRLFVERLEDETLLINMICGVVSGVISSTIANPTDVLKIRMQAQGSLFQGSMIGSFIDIYQQEGTRGLWRGVVPTAQRAAIVVGVELPVYDITKKHLILSGMMGDTILTHFVSSFTCGLAGALASNPVDVVRTRMMNQRAIVGHVDLYQGTVDGILKMTSKIKLSDVKRKGNLPDLNYIFQMWKHEGFFALYKGFWPNWLRLGPWNIIVSF
ncbi:Brain mitochondrial carrier protein 1 [Galemys pyrenaicus]|uniref:Brain mitochondrial carrier protein 1 n=1 Tax=Galemys pyrenaicus TaxID=202257 RepID=A0A8J6BJY9_GALPY|nr:Brain mitochondrial carrier protein 1 [Galemys pyrenaicus]